MDVYNSGWRIRKGSFKSLKQSVSNQLLLISHKPLTLSNSSLLTLVHACVDAVPGRESACELKMYHQEDGGVGREMAKVAFRRGIWNYVVKMDTQLRRYALKHAQLKIDPASAVALARKVPAYYTLCDDK